MFYVLFTFFSKNSQIYRSYFELPYNILLTPTQSVLDVLNQGTLIIHNGLPSRLFKKKSFIIQILLKDTNENFRNISRKFVITIFVEIIFCKWTLFCQNDLKNTRNNMGLRSKLFYAVLERWIFESFRETKI